MWIIFQLVRINFSTDKSTFLIGDNKCKSSTGESKKILEFCLNWRLIANGYFEVKKLWLLLLFDLCLTSGKFKFVSCTCFSLDIFEIPIKTARSTSQKSYFRKFGKINLHIFNPIQDGHFRDSSRTGHCTKNELFHKGFLQ